MKFGMRIGLAVLALAAIVGVGAVVGEKALSGEFAYAAEATAIGAAMPDFKLKDTDGKEHTLSGLKGKIVVLNFSSHQCPFSRGADPAISALADKYKDKNVVFIGVDSSKNNSAEDVAKHIADAKISYPIVKDPENKYADAVGAKVTPEIYVVDADGNLAYHGAPDNRTSPEGEADKHYLDDALSALTAGEEVKVKEVKAWGCGIKRV